jgi:FecR protein
MSAFVSARRFASFFPIPFFIVGMIASLPKPALAQDPSQDDPPGRVGRLNFMQGSVSYQVSGDTDWVQADPNRPLTTGDNLWVDEDSRGEVHIGSTAIRMSSQTGISFLTLDDRTAQVQLAQGVIEVHVRKLSPGDAFEIDTPNLAFTLARGGEYRIASDPDGGSTVITVREGEGEVTGGGQTWDLLAGQMYTFNGTDDISYDAANAPGYDDFENWCQSRDQHENASLSAKYVSRDVDGYYDLDDYGQWHNDPDYGAVWVPNGVAAGWAPYQVGHWVYVAPWGWTWVDAEPWGFAPFHYGRWAFVGGYWGWVPGPVVVRPVYAPALVGFVGGGGFGVSVAFGGGLAGVAWFPLGPRDVFVPAYHVSPRYFTNINVTNTRVVRVTDVTNVYTNVYVNHSTTVVNNYTYARNQVAVTAVSRDTFVNARPVVGATVQVSAEQIQSARVVDSAPLAPTRASYVSATAKVSSARPKVAFSQRPVVARLTPAVSRSAPQPANRPGFQSFNNNDRGAAISGHDAGRVNTPPGDNAANNNRGNNAPGGAVDNKAQQSQPASRDGFRPFTPPANGAANNDTRRGQTDSTVNNNQSMHYAPPAKARDEDYDVHPPLNQNQPQAKPEPKPEQKQERPPQKEEKKDDKDKDKK